MGTLAVGSNETRKLSDVNNFSVMTKEGLKEAKHEDLISFKGQLNQAIAEKQETERAEAEVKVRALAEKLGFTLEDIMRTASAKTQRMVTAQRVDKHKYRNPNNPNDTWSGHSIPPNWMRDLISAGKTKEDFLII